MAWSQAPYIHVILADVVPITWYLIVRLTTVHYQSTVNMISFPQVLTAQWSNTIPCQNVWFQVGITSHDIPFQQKTQQICSPSPCQLLKWRNLGPKLDCQGTFGLVGVLKQNIVRCYSNSKPNIPTRNCMGSLHSQDLCNDIVLTMDW